jgi:hypothetical protein
MKQRYISYEKLLMCRIRKRAIFLAAFDELLIREQRLWIELITQPDFAATYARYRQHVDKKHPVSKWFKRGWARHFGGASKTAATCMSTDTLESSHS